MNSKVSHLLSLQVSDVSGNVRLRRKPLKTACTETFSPEPCGLNSGWGSRHNPSTEASQHFWSLCAPNKKGLFSHSTGPFWWPANCLSTYQEALAASLVGPLCTTTHHRGALQPRQAGGPQPHSLGGSPEPNLWPPTGSLPSRPPLLREAPPVVSLVPLEERVNSPPPRAPSYPLFQEEWPLSLSRSLALSWDLGH